MDTLAINAQGLYYKELNQRVREAVRSGAREITLDNVNGQRYIANCLEGDIRLIVNGVPGQDLAAFMRGPRLIVHGNAQDGVANTMDDGEIVIHGLAGDVLGYGMRGGRVFVRGDVGYRVGIHMKAYMDKSPLVVIGGKAGDFLGEYMAGGAIVLLGMNTEKPEAPIAGRSLGTGMHGGVIFVRGGVPDHLLGPGLHSQPLDEEDEAVLRSHVKEYASVFQVGLDEILSQPFVKIQPFSHRPYKNMYVGTN